MSITETVEFDNEGRIIRHSVFDKIFLTLIIVLVALLSFGIGRLSVLGEREGVSIEYDEAVASTPSTSNQTASVIQALQEGSVVASKNGSKYHYPHCSGAKQIAEKNKITFASISAAESSGYTLAANCKPR